MSGVNKVFIIGNLGSDPVTNGPAVNISIATSDQWKDKQTGQPVERTEWHRVVGFGKLGEIMASYLKKGSKVYIEGSLRTSKYQKDGVDRYSTDIIANKMQMLDSRGENSEERGIPRPGGWDIADDHAGGNKDPIDDIPF